MNVTFTFPLTVFSPSFAAGVINVFVDVTFLLSIINGAFVSLSINTPFTVYFVFGFKFSYVTVSIIFTDSSALVILVFVSESYAFVCPPGI